MRSITLEFTPDEARIVSLALLHWDGYIHKGGTITQDDEDCRYSARGKVINAINAKP